MSSVRNKNILSANLDMKQISLGLIEVLRRRRSSKESCNPESERWDELLFQKIADSLNCRPSHWTNVDYQSLCNNSQAMERSNFMERIFIDPDILGQMTAPCDELIDVDAKIENYARGGSKTFGSTDMKDNFEIDLNSAILLVEFERTIYREISNFRTYNFEGLIGNGGGYVGLFLGFAVWQIPDFCNFVFNFFVEKVNH